MKEGGGHLDLLSIGVGLIDELIAFNAAKEHLFSLRN